MKTGTVREDDYGNLHFNFDDGTTAIAYWVPIGELGDGQGGGFEEDDVYPNDSGLSASQVLALANENIACCGTPVPIRHPHYLDRNTI